jgi:hypothetical protein
MAAKITAGPSAIASCFQQILSPAFFKPWLRGRTAECAFWVKTSTVTGVRAFIDDGTIRLYSDPHPGDGSYQFLAVERTIDAVGASKLVAGVEGIASASWWQNGGVVVLGKVPPTGFVMPSCVRRTITLQIPGPLQAATTLNGFRFSPDRPTLVQEMRLLLGTPSAGQAVIAHEIPRLARAFARWTGGRHVIKAVEHLRFYEDLRSPRRVWCS